MCFGGGAHGGSILSEATTPTYREGFGYLGEFNFFFYLFFYPLYPNIIDGFINATFLVPPCLGYINSWIHACETKRKDRGEKAGEGNRSVCVFR
jgi:hypothetical protein